MARDISVSLDGSTFTIETGSGGLRIRTRLMGLHNISNILAATGIAIASGVEHEYIKKGLEGLALVPGRLESVGVDAPFRIFVDYAHTDDALYNVLTLLAGLAPRGIITVFGCGGDRDKLKRPRMGRVACELSDKVVITSDNPRSEDPRDIIADITKGTRGKFSNFLIEEDRAEAIKRALRMARKGDIVLIAGKGHERYQIVGDKMRPFDDREVVKSYFGELCALR
jgi:UDP-N-acetylmuramoyl-L-alanyl-D-glutamate--2,6-diaminopimelate ligase